MTTWDDRSRHNWSIKLSAHVRGHGIARRFGACNTLVCVDDMYIPPVERARRLHYIVQHYVLGIIYARVCNHITSHHLTRLS
jgi:hypothetical protein